MKITTDTTFTDFESVQRQAYEAAILRAVAQVEAARELLEGARSGGHQTEFWARAVEFAEAEEAARRRAFSLWRRRDRNAALRAFDFTRALSGATSRHLNALERSDERALIGRSGGR